MEALLGKNIEELRAVAQSVGLPKFAASQLAEWIYKKGATSFDQMTNMEKNGVAYDKSFGCTPFAEGLLAGAEEYRGDIPLTMKEAMEGYFRKAEDTLRKGLLKNDLAAEGLYDLPVPR